MVVNIDQLARMSRSRRSWCSSCRRSFAPRRWRGRLLPYRRSSDLLLGCEHPPARTLTAALLARVVQLALMFVAVTAVILVLAAVQAQSASAPGHRPSAPSSAPANTLRAAWS